VFDLRAERADLVADVERGDALIRAALGCRRMIELAAGGDGNHTRRHAASIVSAAEDPGQITNS
jgi:hypothetical protein